MNIINISLSSNNQQYISTLNTVLIYDHTNFIINLDNIYNKIVPIYMSIDWGDGSDIKNYDNDLSMSNRVDVTLGTLFKTTYGHQYYPSPTSLYRNLTAQVYIEYCDGLYNWFTIPLKIRTSDYFESIYDMELIHTNIIPTSNNPKEHQFLTNVGNYCIELRSS